MFINNESNKPADFWWAYCLYFKKVLASIHLLMCEINKINSEFLCDRNLDSIVEKIL